MTLAGAGALRAEGGSGTRWVVEQMPGGTVKIRDGELEIADRAGCTVWLGKKLRAPVTLSYDITVIEDGGPLDRVSDVNCFWMATDPRAPGGCPFAPGFGRSGKFGDYDSLRTYYVGMGGNDNTTTRFRRYAGDGTRPLLPGHDLRDGRFLLRANRAYHIEISVRAGMVEYRRDGEVFFCWKDPEPLAGGWFAFRTVHSHQLIRHFHVDEG